MPLPSDALVTPVTFRVRKRQLRGILSEFDAAETGLRELSGEWVVGKKTWQRLQSEWRAASPQDTPDDIPHKPGVKTKEQVILYLHGGTQFVLLVVLTSLTLSLGAYLLSSAAAQRLISIPLSKYTDARVFGAYVHQAHLYFH